MLLSGGLIVLLCRTIFVRTVKDGVLWLLM